MNKVIIVFHLAAEMNKVIGAERKNVLESCLNKLCDPILAPSSLKRKGRKHAVK